ncbi:hypothetical protein SAMN05216327_102302 [Dyadobacter sp. SG02]|uniref:hypothetical protein n=1 Tax=Dyadobacter sp. SG02 TaxID=1855291 RepID=UPI0008C0D46F|nr:hypothetical protein [Dyadobacter sp. SG02]SEI53593.1 hypothetical protein SAMN05216327_102302 [Dyadobacter sp. SG02]
MHPDDELGKLLRERFARYEPEPETSWEKFETRLADSSKPARKKRPIVMTVVVLILTIGGIGFWASRPSRSRSAESTVSQSIHSRPHLAGNRQPMDDSQKPLRHSGSAPALDGHSKPLRLSRNAPTLSTQIVKEADRSAPENKRRFTTTPLKPALTGSYKLDALLTEAPPANEMSEIEISDNKPAAMLPLASRQASDLVTGFAALHVPVPPNNEKPGTYKPGRLQPAWVIKAGPLLGYNGMSSVERENNSALGLENLRTSLPERLGWHLHIARQHPLSNGRQLEIGAVFRQFRQDIRYQVPTGAYSVQVQPDNSVTVTQLRDTLSDRSVIRQAGLRLGLTTPVLRAAGLYGGIGGEAVYQFNLGNVVVNAEVVIGKKLATAHAATVMVELFANSAIRPVYDSQRWLRVLPYHIGLRVGVPLRAPR